MVKGDPANGAGFSTSCWSRAHRGWLPSAPTTTGCCGSVPPCCAPPARPAVPAVPATCAPWTSGTGTWPARRRAPGGAARAGRGAAASGRRAYVAVAGADTVTDLEYRSSVTLPGRTAADACKETRRACRREAGQRPRWIDRSASRGVDARRSGRVRPQEIERGVTLVGPHRDELLLTVDGTAGSRLRQPRRVVVARIGAAARVVRAAAGGRPGTRAAARRRVRRARRAASSPTRRARRRRGAGTGHGGGRRTMCRPSSPDLLHRCRRGGDT